MVLEREENKILDDFLHFAVNCNAITTDRGIVHIIPEKHHDGLKFLVDNYKKTRDIRNVFDKEEEKDYLKLYNELYENVSKLLKDNKDSPVTPNTLLMRFDNFRK